MHCAVPNALRWKSLYICHSLACVLTRTVASFACLPDMAYQCCIVMYHFTHSVRSLMWIVLFDVDRMRDRSASCTPSTPNSPTCPPPPTTPNSPTWTPPPHHPKSPHLEPPPQPTLPEPPPPPPRSSLITPSNPPPRLSSQQLVGGGGSCRPELRSRPPPPRHPADSRQCLMRMV